MIWSLYANLGVEMWRTTVEELRFHDEAWERIVSEAHASGLNMIVLDVGEGIQWKSHPELAVKNAWGYYRVKKEIQRLRDIGIALIPKLNFSATHALWMGEYRKMMSTKIYYDVCRDLLEEIYDLFEKPEYIHIGMDEEGNVNILRSYEGLINFRKGELLWHDLKFLCDTVTSLGAKPWIWADICCEQPEEFSRRFDKDSVLLSPWYYFAFKKEHYKKISDCSQADQDFYANTYPYDQMNLTYIEEDPGYVKMREDMINSASLGYGLVPCFSCWGKTPYNAPDMVELYKNIAPEHLRGFMVAPWAHTLNENVDEIIENIRVMAEQMKQF